MPVERTGPLAPATVELPAGSKLHVFAEDASSQGFIRCDTYRAPKTWVDSAGPVVIGPYQSRTAWTLKATFGGLLFEVKEPIVEAIERATEAVRVERVATTAQVERKKAMALQDKLRELAEKSKRVPQRISDRADEVSARWDVAEKRGEEAFSRLEAVIVDAERGVAATEDAVNQLTNGLVDPLPGSTG
jgi:hypothetical protein